MNAKRKLRSALDYIDDAQRALTNAKRNTEQDNEISKALRELDDAVYEIERAIREID